MFDVAVIGGGISGFATAARLQAAGLSTAVIESHSTPGGCAGYFRRRGFAFDVGATTLVDFAPNGIGGELIRAIGLESFEAEILPGYVAWLPDRTVTLHRERSRWLQERLRAFGDTPDHRRLWALFDRIEDAFWPAARRGVRLPMQSLRDVFGNLRALGASHLPMLRYLPRTLSHALQDARLHHDRPLAALLSMLVEDTVHAPLSEAPLINAVLGCSIRGAGLTRSRGGMFGFWRRFSRRYIELGGRLLMNHVVTTIRGRHTAFTIETSRQTLRARQVVCSLPIHVTAQIAPPSVTEALQPHLERNRNALGGAFAVFLGVPEHEVAGHAFTHHQILADYDVPLGNGNNMFISVSAARDCESAPAGFRSVVLSTHCDLAPWRNLDHSQYLQLKARIMDRLIELARRVYPRLGENAVVREAATPRTYQRFTRRPDGAVGGFQLSLANANRYAVPQDIGVKGFWLCGDTTWPGLGTVAAVLGSRIAAEHVLETAPRSSRSAAAQATHLAPHPDKHCRAYP